MDGKRKTAIHSSMYHQCKERGYATTVDVLMDIGVLQRSKYLEWRNGKVPFLEKACEGNLHKLSERREMRSYASAQGLTPSVTVYKQWGVKKKHGQGHRPVVRLRFSKSGMPAIEDQYATHYVNKREITKLREMHNTVAAVMPKEENSDIKTEEDHDEKL